MVPRLPWGASWGLPSEAAWHELRNLTAFALQQCWPAGHAQQHGDAVVCSVQAVSESVVLTLHGGCHGVVSEDAMMHSTANSQQGLWCVGVQIPTGLKQYRFT